MNETNEEQVRRAWDRCYALMAEDERRYQAKRRRRARIRQALWYGAAVALGAALSWATRNVAWTASGWEVW